MTDLFTHLQSALADRYTLERELGRGGMATVYLARDLRHKRPVALKVLHPELAYALGADRFLREIEVAANLSHPHILPLHDSGEAAGLLYYVMPYVDGESLRDRLTRETQLPVDQALQIAREVADALAYAHGQGVIHRDIKPENILLSSGHALVADFGIARALDQAGGARLTETGMAVGTAAYMSPEQASGERHIDGRSDVYSLGCVVYEMLAGEPPYTGPTAQAILAKRFSDPVPAVRRVRPAVPEGLEHAITKALAPVAADRFATAAEFARALAHPATAPGTLPSHIGKGKPRTTTRLLWLVLAVGLAGLLVIGGIQFRGRTSPALNANLLAVAPFDVPNPELKLWQEGLVDLLSRNFDGAGSLHSVPPTVVVRRFKGRADRATATELGRRTGAQLVLFGALLAAGDSARLSATLLDVERGRVLGEVEVRDSITRMDRLADSLTVRLLRELGHTRRVGAVLSMSFGSTSLPALRAFLQGEQFYRLGHWDSAIGHYERAISLDSTLAPAYRRMGNVIGWRNGSDSLSVVYRLRAGSLNHGLAPRESLLVTADSLIAAAISSDNDSLYYALVERLFSTASEATRRYPNDPEAWYTLGEVRHHMGYSFGVTGHQVLEAFDRSIALDSAFALAYIHNVDLALNLGGPKAARRYVRAYLALDPTDIHAVGIRAVAKILDSVADGEAGLQQLLDTLPALPLGQVMITFQRFPDPEETAARIFRRFATDARGSRFSDPGFRRWEVGILGYRGHLHEAYTEVGTQGPGSLYPWSALLGVIPRDTARTVFARWLNERSDAQASFALPWWSATGDTVSLRRFMQWYDTPERPRSHRILQGMKRYWAAAAGGYLALARRDSAQALRRFTQLPESLCSGASCLTSRLTKAQLLSAMGQHREAAIVLQRDPSWTDSPPQLVEVFWLLERGRVAERLNDREQALRSFHTVADTWVHADLELQPYVEEARAAIQRLSGEVP